MIYDIIIIGAGMAGLTAAIYACRAKKKVLVLEKTIPGGQIINSSSIANWPGSFKISGAELMSHVCEQALALGADIAYEEVTNINQDGRNFVVVAGDQKYSTGAIILAIGASSKKMGLPNEIKMTGRGVSYCATCDGAFYKDKNVAVIGGGNTALYDALYLANIAKKVYLIHRRSEFKGDKILVDKLREKDNVEFILEHTLAEILGDDKVTGIQLSPSSRTLEVDGIFIAIGERPMSDNFSSLVELDPKGYIVAGEDCETSCPGIFVAGDCRTKNIRQLVTAAADGAIAASAAVKYLNK